MAIALDNLGREISSANMSLGEIRGLISTLCKEKVGNASPYGKGKGDERQGPLGTIRQLFETYVKDFSQEMNEQKEFLQEVVSTIKDITNSRNTKKQEKGKKDASKEEKATAKSSEKLAREFHRTLGTKGSGWVHDPYCETVLKQILAAITHKGANRTLAIEQIAKNSANEIRRAKRGGKGGGGGGDIATGIATAPDDDDAFDEIAHEKLKERHLGGWIISSKEVKSLMIAHYIAEKIMKISHAIQNNFMGFDGVNVMLKGISSEERHFTQEVRATAYEIAGVTKEAKKLQKIYEDMGDTAAETGFDRSIAQKFYLKTLKSGIRDNKTALSITKTQLNTERQIGVEAGTLSDTFMYMAQAGRLNNIEIGQMGRGMLNVARNSGLSGEHLAAAIKSSEEITKLFVRSGRLSAEVATNVQRIVANAKKLGVEGELAADLKAMSSSYDFLYATDAKTQTFLSQAARSVGQMSKLLDGSMLHSEESIEKMGVGYANVMQRFFANGIPEEARKSTEAMAAWMESLTDAEKDRADKMLRVAYGENRGLGVVISELEAMSKAGKGLAGQLAELAAKRNLNLNEEEKAMLAEQKRSLIEGKNLEILTALSKATKSAGGMEEALTKFGEVNKDKLSKDLKAMGREWTTSSDVAKDSIQQALDTLNMGRKKHKQPPIKISTKELESAMKDEGQFNVLVERLQKGQQELATAQKTGLDPMSEMNQSLLEINDNVRQYTQSLFSKLFNSVIGQMIAIAGVLASILTAVIGVGMQIYYGFNSFRTLLRHISEDAVENVAKAAGRVVGNGSKVAAGAGHAMPAGLGNFGGTAPGAGNAGGVVRAQKTMFEYISQQMRIMGKKAERVIVGTTDSWAKSIATATEQAAKNPLKSYGELVKQSWQQVWKTSSKIATEGASSLTSGVSTGFGNMVSWFRKVDPIHRIADTVISGFRNIPTLIKDVPRMIGTALSGLKSLPMVLTKGVGYSLGAVVKGGGKAAGSLLKIAGAMNPLGLAITAAFLAVDGLTGGLAAGARAHKIFNKEQKDVTLNEEYAAKTAGMLIGVLNGLTFGIAGLFLPLDQWTDALAQFNAKVPLLTIVLTPLMVTLELLWGVIKGLGLGIWEVLKGLWDGVKNILYPVYEGFSDIFSTLGSMFGGTTTEASGFVQAFREMGGVVGIVSNAIKYVGVAIGWIFKAIGSVVGFILKTFLKVVEGLLFVFEPFAEVLKTVWDAVLEVGTAFAEIGMTLWASLKPVREVFEGIGIELSGLFGGDGKGFFEAVKEGAKILAQFAAILIKFVVQPLIVLAKIIGGIAQVVGSIAKFFRGDITGGEVLKTIQSAIGSVLMAMVQPVIDTYKQITGWFYKLYHWLVGGSLVPDLVNGIMTWFGKLPSIIYGFVGKAISAVADMAYRIPDLLWSLGEKIIDLVLTPHRAILNFFFGGSGDKMVSKVKKFFKVIFGVMVKPFKILAKIASGFGNIVGAVGALLSGDLKNAGTLVTEAFSGVWNELVSPFKKFGQWLWDITIGKMKGFGQWLWDNTIGRISKIFDFTGENSGLGTFVAGFYKALTEGVGGFVINFFGAMAAGIPAFAAAFYDGLTGALGRAWDWFQGRTVDQTTKGQLEQGAAIQKKVLGERNLTEQKEMLKTLMERKAGAEASLKKNQAEAASGWNPLNWNIVSGAAAASQKNITSDKASIVDFEKRIQELQKSIADKEAQEATQKDMQKLTEEATKKGSIYTHDIHCESLLKQMVDHFATGGVSSKISGIVSGFSSVFNFKKPDIPQISDFLNFRLPSVRKPTGMNQDYMPWTEKGENMFPGTIKGLPQIKIPSMKGLAPWMKEEGPETMLPQPKIKAEGKNRHADLEGQITKHIVETQPPTTEIVSQDLGELTSEASEMNANTAELVELFKKFLELAKPKSQPITSSGSSVQNTGNNSVNHRPSNYHRATIGHVAQTAAKGVLNVGSQTI